VIENEVREQDQIEFGFFASERREQRVNGATSYVQLTAVSVSTLLRPCKQ